MRIYTIYVLCNIFLCILIQFRFWLFARIFFKNYRIIFLSLTNICTLFFFKVQERYQNTRMHSNRSIIISQVTIKSPPSMTIAFHLRIESFVNDLPQIGEGKYTAIEDKINEAMRACNGNVGRSRGKKSVRPWNRGTVNWYLKICMPTDAVSMSHASTGSHKYDKAL